MRRLYACFERNGKRWDRLPGPALPIQRARVYYQDRLLARFMGAPCGERSLRPVKREPTYAQVMAAMDDPERHTHETRYPTGPIRDLLSLYT
jgi:hypothetical protein